MRRRGRHVALRGPRNFADRHRRVTRHRAGVSLSLLWPPLLNEKTKKVHSPFSTSAHVFYVHMPKAFAEHCSINKWNEEIWENSHILNKRLIHVAVFPGGTAKYTPEERMERPQYQGNTPREAVTAASYVPPELLQERRAARARPPPPPPPPMPSPSARRRRPSRRRGY